MSKQEYEMQRQWADGFLDLQKEILNENMMHIDFNKCKLRKAAKYIPEDDMSKNTDLMIYLYKNLRIALRVRDTESCPFRDLTIRSRNGGHKTEIDKIREGYGDYMLYCWGSEENKIHKIHEWALVDLDEFRKKEDQLAFTEIANYDGRTWFYIYNLKQLKQKNVIVNQSLQ